jgi:hypothetical protein
MFIRLLLFFVSFHVMYAHDIPLALFAPIVKYLSFLALLSRAYAFTRNLDCIWNGEH